MLGGYQSWREIIGGSQSGYVGTSPAEARLVKPPVEPRPGGGHWLKEPVQVHNWGLSFPFKTMDTRMRSARAVM